MRRIFAWIIDWNLSGVPTIVYVLLFSEYFARPSLQNAGLVLGLLFFVMLFPVILVFRDVIFAGRSIGKRIFGLHIIDKRTNEPVSVGKRIIRNLFFFIYPVDGIILLATKESIGDKIAKTIVVKKDKEKF